MRNQTERFGKQARGRANSTTSPGRGRPGPVQRDLRGHLQATTPRRPYLGEEATPTEPRRRVGLLLAQGPEDRKRGHPHSSRSARCPPTSPRCSGPPWTSRTTPNGPRRGRWDCERLRQSRRTRRCHHSTSKVRLFARETVLNICNLARQHGNQTARWVTPRWTYRHQNERPTGRIRLATARRIW